MSRRHRESKDPAALDLNALAASCNVACGEPGTLLWDRGAGVRADIVWMGKLLRWMDESASLDKPGSFAEQLGELVFDALGLAGALGVDIAKEVELVRKRAENAGFSK